MVDIYLREIINNYLHLMSYVYRKFDDETIMKAISKKARESLIEEYTRFSDFYNSELNESEIDAINEKIGFKLIEKLEE